MLAQQAAGYLVYTPFRTLLNKCHWHLATLAAVAKYPCKHGYLARSFAEINVRPFPPLPISPRQHQQQIYQRRQKPQTEQDQPVRQAPPDEARILLEAGVRQRVLMGVILLIGAFPPGSLI